MSDSATDIMEARIFFPPRPLVDFVIHYDNTVLHVHKFVLHHHSTYFRAFFLTPPQPADNMSPSSKDGNTCHHATTAYCIHLPRQTTLNEKQVVTAADFDLFLRHLYFSAHYCYPPFQPQSDVDLDADQCPLSQTFPSIPSLDWSVQSSQLRFTADRKGVVFKESLLMLAHYFDCAAMMAQCEAVFLLMMKFDKRTRQRAWLSNECLSWLLVADRYHLSKYKKACIEVIAADNGVLQRKEYETQRKAGVASDGCNDESMRCTNERFHRMPQTTYHTTNENIPVEACVNHRRY